MAVTYENLLKVNIGRECKCFLEDLLDNKSEVEYDVLEVMEVKLGDIYMDASYSFTVKLGILGKDYKKLRPVNCKGIIGIWGINILMVEDFYTEYPIWYTNNDLNIVNGISRFEI